MKSRFLENETGGRRLHQVKKPDLHAEVVTQIAELIADASPHHRLPTERVLSERLGVGRSTIREAMRSLSFFGFIYSVQGDGTYVSDRSALQVERLVGLGLLINRSVIREVIEARSLLEADAASLAAQHRMDEDLTELRKIVHKMRLHTDNPRTAAKYDLAFHVCVARASQNSVLAFFIEGMRTILEAWMHKAVNRQVVVKEILDEHQAILEAIIKQDSVAASNAMTYHLARASARLLEVISPEASVADEITNLIGGIPKGPCV